MNKITNLMLLNVAVIMSIYLPIAFVVADINFIKWAEEARILAVVMYYCGTGVSIAIIYGPTFD